MKSVSSKLLSMVNEVAEALGNELLSQVAFVGGCTTCLLITDDFSKESVRYTQDVDLIIDIIGYPAWASFQENLRSIGFKEDSEEGPICRMRLRGLKVDFMPVDPQILGFSNRWYSEAIKTAQPYDLSQNVQINILTPVMFFATKFEAYQGRGKNDPLESHDIEDIINLFDGREELVTEINQADNDVRRYISDQVKQLLQHSFLDYVLQSHTRNSAPGRAKVIRSRLKSVVQR